MMTLSIEQVLAISPFVFNGIFIALITWNIAYVKRAEARAGSGAGSRETLKPPCVIFTTRDGAARIKH